MYIKQVQWFVTNVLANLQVLLGDMLFSTTRDKMLACVLQD